jgi:arylsulfatase A-like enzyme
MRSLLCLSLAVLAVAACAQRQPNVVFIVSDDAGYGDFGFTGSLQIETPSIDSIAKNGVTFTQGYVSGPVCSPSRAGFLTGRHQLKFGHEFNDGVLQEGDDPDLVGLPVEQLTIADHMKALGYKTGIVGKWHMGLEEHFHPRERGFDEWYFFRGGARSYWEIKGNRYNRLEAHPEEVQPVTYLTDDFGAAACRFIERSADDPFFLFLSFNAPHLPLHAKEEDLEKYDWIEDKQRRTFCAMIDSMDQQVGAVLKTLEDQDLDEDTIVIFMNDNGGHFDTGAINAPFNGMKGTMLEGGIRVPFCISWPGKIAAGSTYDKPVLSLDITATSIAAGGGELPTGKNRRLDGHDLIPYLNGAEGQPHETLYWRMGYNAAVRDGDWKLIRMADRPPMLFNLAKDISEQNNLLTEKPEKAADLFKKLFAWEATLKPAVFRAPPSWLKMITGRYDRDFIYEQPPGKGG